MKTKELRVSASTVFNISCRTVSASVIAPMLLSDEQWVHSELFRMLRLKTLHEADPNFPIERFFI